MRCADPIGEAVQGAAGSGAGSMTRKAKKQAVAAPYEPTEREQQAVASYEARRAKRRPAPTLKIERSGDNVLNIGLDHPDPPTGGKMLLDAVGSSHPDFLEGLISQTVRAATTKDGEVDAGKVDFIFAVVRGVEPNDQMEAMLGSQMALIQMASMKAAGAMHRNAASLEAWERYERSLNRLTRTFAAQMEALKRYRSKGEQRVYVERVNVEQGGQAIVGNVETGDRGRG